MAGRRLASRARDRASYLLRCGAIVRGGVCDDCKRAGNIEMHHEDYLKPEVVIWLCRWCHCSRHQKARKEGRTCNAEL